MHIIMIILIGICGWKAIMGFHFPWEKCPCCGKKYRDHKSDTQEFIDSCRDEFERGLGD